MSAETTMAFSGETGFTEGLIALAILGYVNPLVTTNTTTFIGASFSPLGASSFLSGFFDQIPGGHP